MDPEDKKLLLETHELAKDTHRIVREMRREQWFHFFFRIFIWIIILVLPAYLFATYMEPIIEQLKPAGSNTQWTGPFGTPSSADIQKLIESYKVKPQ